jgi:hypothetical protein
MRSFDMTEENLQEQTGHTGFGNDVADNLHVRQLCRVRLFVYFDHTNRVGARVRHGRRAEAQECTTTQFG